MQPGDRDLLFLILSIANLEFDDIDRWHYRLIRERKVVLLPSR